MIILRTNEINSFERLKKTIEIGCSRTIKERNDKKRTSLEIILNNLQHNIFYKQLGKLHITFFIKNVISNKQEVLVMHAACNV